MKLLIAAGMFMLTGSLNQVTGGDVWKIFTDNRDTRDVELIDNQLWCATGGGLVALDLENYEFQQFNPVDGLAGIGITAMAKDSSGGLWLAFQNGKVQRFEPGTGVTHDVMGLDSQGGIGTVNRIIISDYGIFLATSKGIARLTYSSDFDRWVWFEEYVKLGEFPQGQAVNDVAVKDNFLWAGTDIGIARTDLNSAVPREWENYIYGNQLPGMVIRDLIVFESQLIAATDSGVVKWEDDRWRNFSSAIVVRRMMVVDDSLRAVRRAGIFTWDGVRWVRNTPQRNFITSMAWEESGRIWAGMRFISAYEGGVALAVEDGYEVFVPDGPSNNTALRYAFTEEGDVLMVGGYALGELGLNRWNGHTWKKWTHPTHAGLIFSFQNRSVVPDLEGGVWIGSWGGGIARFKGDDTIDFYNHSEETGSRLIGYEGNLDRPLTSDLSLDMQGNLWLINRGAADRKVLICIPRDFINESDPDREWLYYDRNLFNNYPHFDILAIDGAGRKWLASTSTTTIDGHGVYVFDDNGTLDDASDDRVWGPLPGLESPIVFRMRWDPAGYMWVGNVDGAYYINANVSSFSNMSFTPLYPLRNHQVNDIAIDAVGNKWFATVLGVVIVGTDFTLKRRITDQAPDLLPGKDVRAVAINPNDGWAYFGTDRGNAAMLTPYRDFGNVLREVTFEPNPFNPNDGKLYFTGNSLANLAEASFFTPDGRLVRKLNHEEAVFGWDGLNETGYKVASGVYLVVTHSSDGKAAKSKVAVIWK